MVVELSVDHSVWQEAIEASGGECLLSSVSAKNVEHVLSKATIRGPQKKLCSAVLPCVGKMLHDNAGISILTSLIKYGTPKSVESIAKAVVTADEDLWKLESEIPKDIVSSLGLLLDSFIYREDSEGEYCTTIVQNLISCPGGRAFGSAFSLLAAGQLFSVNEKFAQQCVHNKSCKEALLKASSSPQMKTNVVGFCKRVLSAANEKTHEMGSVFLLNVFGTVMRGKEHQIREEIVLAIVSHATPEVVNKVGSILTTWPDIGKLVERDAYAKIVCEVLARATDAQMCANLSMSIIHSVAAIDVRLNSRKTPQLRLLAAISGRPEAIAALSKKLGASAVEKIKAAKIRFIIATTPKCIATQNSIREKIRQLEQSSKTKNPVVGVKRLRE